MQLTYRGISYNAAPAFTPTVASGSTVTYRGIPYTVKNSNTVAILPTKSVMYRGIVIDTPKVTNQQISCPATVYGNNPKTANQPDTYCRT